jgi:MFS family permease
MRPFLAAFDEYASAVASFSRPARLFLLSAMLTWSAHGLQSVLFNLFLSAQGHREAFIGQAIALNGIGLAIAALPAGLLADRWGRRRCLILGAAVETAGMLARALVDAPGVILGASFVLGAGQSLLAIAAAPFLSEHSTARERTHLFSAFFAIELFASVIGSLLGGAAPQFLRSLPAQDWLAGAMADRATLVIGGLLAAAAILPYLRMAGLQERPLAHGSAPPAPAERRQLVPIAVNAFLIGAGAGLVIPFMNLYFAGRFGASSAQIGVFFSLAQVSTALAALLAPVLARRFGKLRTATVSQLMSLPFLITLGAESHLHLAVGAFWLRATFMQAATPLLGAFVMETLPPALRARATSLMNLVWNVGWATSAILSGALIQRFGYAVPFYVTACLYGSAALYFYLSFRGLKEASDRPIPLSDEAKGLRGTGPTTE